MNKPLHVKPAPGRQVRLENGDLMPTKGAHVPSTRYYRRRLRDGDLVPAGKTQTKKQGADS